MSGDMSSDEIKLPTRHNIVFPVRRLESVTDASYQPSCSDCHVKSERTIDCAVNAAGFRMINEPVFMACQYESTVRCSFPLVFFALPAQGSACGAAMCPLICLFVCASQADMLPKRMN